MDNQSTSNTVAISKKVRAVFNLNRTDLADLFSEMNGFQQAQFFNALAENVVTWAVPLCFQL